MWLGTGIEGRDGDSDGNPSGFLSASSTGFNGPGAPRCSEGLGSEAEDGRGRGVVRLRAFCLGRIGNSSLSRTENRLALASELARAWTAYLEAGPAVFVLNPRRASGGPLLQPGPAIGGRTPASPLRHADVLWRGQSMGGRAFLSRGSPVLGHPPPRGLRVGGAAASGPSPLHPALPGLATGLRQEVAHRFMVSVPLSP
jgi:hypothetical protein